MLGLHVGLELSLYSLSSLENGSDIRRHMLPTIMNANFNHSHILLRFHVLHGCLTKVCRQTLVFDVVYFLSRWTTPRMHADCTKWNHLPVFQMIEENMMVKAKRFFIFSKYKVFVRLTWRISLYWFFHVYILLLSLTEWE